LSSLSSWGGYNDELVWAALWLYKATGTQSYLTYAITGYSAYGFSNYADVLSWDSKISGTKVLLAQITGQASYVTDVQNICNYYINQVPKSPLGEPFFSYWGNLRYTATAGFTCLMVSYFFASHVVQLILYRLPKNCIICQMIATLSVR
jgi:endoglucanase